MRNLTHNSIEAEDLRIAVAKLAKFAQSFDNKVVLVTGATGLIGRYVTLILLAMTHTLPIKIRVVAQGRNLAKLEDVFSVVKDDTFLHLWADDLMGNLEPPLKPNFIIHAASPTTSCDFVEKPIEVIESIYQSTVNVLDLADRVHVQSMLYLSSMEVYGFICGSKTVTENHVGTLEMLSLRSSYPQAKRLAELLCASYARERGLSVKIARLSMIFGPGVKRNDNRVLNYFIEQIRCKRSIKLVTAGKSKASVLYLREAVEALVYLLFLGHNGEAYNVANPTNYMSIYDMATIASHLTDVEVICGDVENTLNTPYPRDNNLNLSTEKINTLGWKPTVCLQDIFSRTLAYAQEH